MKEEQLMEYYNNKLQQVEMQQATNELHHANNAIAARNELGGQLDVSILKEQLSLDNELTMLDYLLRGWSLVRDPTTGSQGWQAPNNEDNRLLSDYGIHVFREALASYMHKGHLLSNYTEEQINDKMLDFTRVINNLVLKDYEKIFFKPTLERCKQELLTRVEERKKIRQYANELIGREDDSDNIAQDIISRAEQEIIAIRKKLFMEKIKKFQTIIRYLQDNVHSVYNRALGGQERRSIRQHIQVTETKGGINMPMGDMPRKGKGAGKWFGRS